MYVCLKIKQGAQTMIEHCGGNKKLLADAHVMLADSRRKVDYIRMQQLRLRNTIFAAPDEDRNYCCFAICLQHCCDRMENRLIFI